MSDYIVSARKYRPASFGSVVGQSALTTTLKNAIATGKLAHAYLFCGPRGVGKTTSARIFAKTINCLSPTPEGEACGHCESCQSIDAQRSYNIHELDAASNNSVDDIRELIDQVQIPPQVGKYKVFIIDEVHMLSQAAFNAFLKTLEEPPAHAIFVLATTEKHKILPTILSRCQIYDFNRMEVADIVHHLAHVATSEGITYEEAALSVIARKADGGMRDALSIFDQVSSYSGGNITYAATIENLNVLDYDYYFDIVDQLLRVDIPQVLLTLGQILSKGFEGNHFIGGLASHLRDLLMSRDAQTLPLLEVAESVRQRYAEQAQRCQPRFLYAALKLCNDCDIHYRSSRNKRLLIEITLIQVAQLLQADDVPASGLRPTKSLLPIFTPAAQSQPAALAATTASVPTPAVGAQPPVSSSSAPAPTPAAPTPSASAPTPTVAASATTTTATPAPSAAPNAYSQQRRQRLNTVSISRRGPRFVNPNPPDALPPTTVLPTLPPIPPGTREEFTFEALCYHWLRYANDLAPEHNALAGRLRMIRHETERLSFAPSDDGQRILVSGLVDTEGASRHLSTISPYLAQYLRNALRNELIDVDFPIDTRQVIQKRAYTDREVYTAMLKENPDFRDLAIRLKLELAY